MGLPARQSISNLLANQVRQTRIVVRGYLWEELFIDLISSSHTDIFERNGTEISDIIPSDNPINDWMKLHIPSKTQ
jgi:hypothetical protein